MTDLRYDTSPIGPGPNWVTHTDPKEGLGPFVRAIVHALIRQGHPEREAIQIALGVVKDWAAGRKASLWGPPSPKTKAKAKAAVAHWEKLKAAAAASHARGGQIMGLEFRTAIGGEFADADDVKREVLWRFPHERVDTYKTTFGVDAFRASFAERLPAICWQHTLGEPIGRIRSAQVTEHANELVGKFSDFDAVPLAHRAFVQIRDGDITDASFGFVREADEPHPEHRGVTRITRARMEEVSPVTIGSIPGAEAVGVRSLEEAPTLTVPDIDTIIRLRAVGLLDEEEGRRMLAQIMPDGCREHIVLTRAPAPTEPQHAGEDAADLASAVDAALDAAEAALDGVDTRSLPDEVQQALALVGAAGVAVDDLLESMGIEDPDNRGEPEGEVRAKYSAEQMRQLLKQGKAFKNAQGEPSFPIADTEDLHNAVRAVGRAGSDHDAVRAYIIKRAKQMGQADAIPDNWNPDGSIKDSSSRQVSDAEYEAVLALLEARTGKVA